MAKDAQRQAEEEAIAEYQRQALLLEERDALIARDVALQLEREEVDQRKRLEEQDQKIAKVIQEKERRQKMRALGDINKVGLPLPPDMTAPYSVVRKVTSVEEQMRELCVDDSVQQNISDCSWPPPPDMEQIMKAQQEKSDEELAKRLQEEEEGMTRSMGLIDRDRLLAIEVQDLELAKMMQAKERAKAKRAKERARAKKQMEAELMQNAERKGDVEEVAAGVVHDGYRLPNIAMAIDPTYSPRHQHQHHHTPPQLLVQHSPQHTLLHHRAAVGDCDYDCEEESPPYMPVQGQRRTSTGSSDKKKKKEKSRDDCKQQ
ncbi:uncharacterized protein isoform X2 [Rhodnius prolixus]